MFLVNVAGEDLDVSTSAVNLLLVLDGVLENQVLALIAEGGELGGVGVETSILGGLETCVAFTLAHSQTNQENRSLSLTLVGFSISVELAVGPHKVTSGSLRGFEIRLDPSVSPVFCIK